MSGTIVGFRGWDAPCGAEHAEAEAETDSG